MQSYYPADLTTLNIQLNELRSRFDHTLRQASDFADLRNIYDHMKELECHIEALQWDSQKGSSHQSSFAGR